MKGIMNWLNSQGVTTNRNQKFTYNSVQTLLTNRRYIGENRFQDIVMPDTIPAHWGFDSTEPNRWGSKFELLIGPTLFTIICLACMGVTRVVKGETYGDGKSSELFMHRTTIGVSIFFFLLELGILTLVAINL